MASNLWTLDDFKDFETIDKVFFSNNTECIKNDGEGYTPLCFAALNGVAPECIAYFMWRANRNEIFNKCNRGKTPLQFACMAMNPITINVLTSNSYNYDRLDTDGQPVYKKDEYGDIKLNSNGEPAWLLQNYIPWKTDSFGNIEYELRNDGSSYVTTESTNGDMIKNGAYICSDFGNPEILSASSLPKSDILATFLNKKYPDDSSYSVVDNKDSVNNTPLHLAVSSQCYASIDLLLIKDSNPANTIATPNKEGFTPFDLAVQMDDTGIVEKLLKYFNGGLLSTILAIEKAAEMQFSKLDTLPENDDILNSLFNNNYTFAILSNKFKLSDGITQYSLYDYYNISSSKQTLSEELSKIFTNKLCTSPSDKTFGFIKPYIMFMQIIITLKIFNVITCVYNRLEDTRVADDDDPNYSWFIQALSVPGHDSRWVSKTTMIDALENQLKAYIADTNNTEYIYNQDDLFNGSTDEDYKNNTHDVIPVNLWSLDYLISNNYSKCLKRMYYADIVSPTKQQKLQIKEATINGNLDYNLVINYLPTINESISDKDYAFLNWLHNTGNLSVDDITNIADAVNNDLLVPGNLLNWPWM